MATDNLLNIDDVPIPCGLIRDGIVFKNSLFESFPKEAQSHFEELASNFLKNSKMLSKNVDFKKKNLQGKIYFKRIKDSSDSNTVLFCISLRRSLYSDHTL